jgi:hypothetical protein
MTAFVNGRWTARRDPPTPLQSPRRGINLARKRRACMTKFWMLSAGAAILAVGFLFAPGAAQAKVCLAGYHNDANGHCQPNHPIPPREICPKGYYAHSAPDRKGYRCKSYP